MRSHHGTESRQRAERRHHIERTRRPPTPRSTGEYVPHACNLPEDQPWSRPARATWTPGAGTSGGTRPGCRPET
jgi:hypothetical protein